MEFILALPLLSLPFVMPFISGIMAKSMGRKFWPWFFLGIPLPLIANLILLYLPDKSKKSGQKTEDSKTERNYLVTDLLAYRINSKDHPGRG